MDPKQHERPFAHPTMPSARARVSLLFLVISPACSAVNTQLTNSHASSSPAFIYCQKYYYYYSISQGPTHHSPPPHGLSRLIPVPTKLQWCAPSDASPSKAIQMTSNKSKYATSLLALSLSTLGNYQSLVGIVVKRAFWQIKWYHCSGPPVITLVI